jgi:hypothetical protein
VASLDAQPLVGGIRALGTAATIEVHPLQTQVTSRRLDFARRLPLVAALLAALASAARRSFFSKSST